MLAEFLSQHPEIASDVATHSAPFEPTTMSRQTWRRRLRALVEDLVRALEERPDLVEILGPSLRVNVDVWERELLRRTILEKLDQHCVNASGRELKVLADWVWSVGFSRLGEWNVQKAELLDLCPDALVIVGHDGKMLYVNRAFAQLMREITGLPGHQIIGKAARELGFLAEGGPSGPAEFKDLARAQTMMEVLVTGRWHELRAQELHGLDGTVRAFGFALRDIQDEKAATARVEMLSKLSRLVGMVDRTDLAMAMAQLPIPQIADWCAVSSIADRAIEYTVIAQRDPSKLWLRDELVRAAQGLSRHPLWRGLSSTGLQMLSDVSDDMLRKLLPDEAAYKLVAQLGIRSLMVVPVVARGQPIAIATLAYTDESGRRYGKDDPGLAVEIAVHAAHIVENARLMREAKASDDRFRIALADARTNVFQQDTALRYVWSYGHDVSFPLVGKTHDDVLPPDEALMLTKMKQAVLDTGVPSSTEIELSYGGKRRWFRETVEAVRDRSGRRIGVIGAATDLTEEKRTQAALNNAIEVRDQLMAIVGHDLRSPLSSMGLTAAKLLRRNELPAEARADLERIERGVHRMAEMIDTLLDFTRVRISGKPLPIDRTPSNPADVLREIVDEAKAASAGQPIELEIRRHGQIAWDERRVGQAVSNLITNAVKYGDSGRPVLVSLDGDEHAAIIRVHNEGRAIPADLLPVLFEPFARGHPDTVSPHGLGLGLFVVKEIVVAHGGTVEVESTREAGTTFTLRFLLSS